MKYYSARFYHSNGEAIHFFAIDREIKREATEKYLEKVQGFKSVVLIQLREFRDEEEYLSAMKKAA